MNSEYWGPSPDLFLSLLCLYPGVYSTYRLRELGILGSISRSISLITLFISQSLQYLQTEGTRNTGVHLPTYFSHYFVYIPEFTVLTDLGNSEYWGPSPDLFLSLLCLYPRVYSSYRLSELGILGSISRSISLITLFISQSLQYLQTKGTRNTGVHLPIYFSHYFVYIPEFTVLTD